MPTMTKNAAAIAHETRCYRRRNAVVALARRLAIDVLAPENLQAETDRAFEARRDRGGAAVTTNEWMSGFYISLEGFTKAQEVSLLADLRAVLAERVHITVHRKSARVARNVVVAL